MGGWSLVCLDPELDLTSASGRAMAGMFAEWERETIGQRIREGLAQSDKRLGRKPGLPPVGGGKPKPIPPQVAAVGRDAAAEGLSLSALVAWLNSYGIESLRGGHWHATSVRRLLSRFDAA